MGHIDTALLIADLQNHVGHSSEISFHDIELCTQKGSSEILGYYHVPDGARWHHGCDDDPKYAKAFTKGHQVAMKVAEILNPTDVGEAATASMLVTSRGIIGGPPCEGHARNVEGITSFQKTIFHFPASMTQTTNLISTRYLHFSTPAAQIVPGVQVGDHGRLNLQSVAILSGMCLFSMKTVLSSITKNQKIDLEKLSGGPTLYEVEYVARAAPVIADLAALVSTNVHQKNRDNSQLRFLNLCMDIPSFHYYQSVDICLAAGTCTFQEALQWMDAIEKRHSQISYVFQGYIHHELSRRRASSIACDIQISPSTDLVRSILRQSLIDGVRPSYCHVLQTLSAQDPIWASFFRLISQKERPQDFRALGYLFYVFQVVRPALVRNSVEAGGQERLASPSANADPARLLISIDDGVERRIYSRAQKILKKLRPLAGYSVSSLLEVYLCRRVFINSNEKGSNLYLDDPSPELMAMDTRKGIFTCEDADNHASSELLHLGPFDVVGKLYGSSVATVIEELCAEVGLSLPRVNLLQVCLK